jgi:hypothetical protein
MLWQVVGLLCGYIECLSRRDNVGDGRIQEDAVALEII